MHPKTSFHATTDDEMSKWIIKGLWIHTRAHTHQLGVGGRVRGLFKHKNQFLTKYKQQQVKLHADSQRQKGHSSGCPVDLRITVKECCSSLFLPFLSCRRLLKNTANNTKQNTMTQRDTHEIDIKNNDLFMIPPPSDRGAEVPPANVNRVD